MGANMRFNAIFWLFFACVVSNAHAAIFKCVKHDGSLLFKDTPCSVRDRQILAPLREEPVNRQDVYDIARQYKQDRQRSQRQKKELRSQARGQKQLELEQKRHLRLQAKCETVKRQIANLHSRYRQGYTAKQGVALDRKMAEYKVKRQQFCK